MKNPYIFPIGLFLASSTYCLLSSPGFTLISANLPQFLLLLIVAMWQTYIGNVRVVREGGKEIQHFMDFYYTVALITFGPAAGWTVSLCAILTFHLMKLWKDNPSRIFLTCAVGSASNATMGLMYSLLGGTYLSSIQHSLTLTDIAALASLILLAKLIDIVTSVTVAAISIAPDGRRAVVSYLKALARYIVTMEMYVVLIPSFFGIIWLLSRNSLLALALTLPALAYCHTAIREATREYSDSNSVVRAAAINSQFELGPTAGAAKLDRCQAVCKAIGVQLNLTEEQLTDLLKAAELHDLGRPIVPPATRISPLPVAHEEEGREHIVGHLTGVNALSHAGFISDNVRAIIRHHHERYDGRGYPDALAERTIPQGAMILHTANTFIALTSPHEFRSAMRPTEALTFMITHCDQQLDPRVVAALHSAHTNGDNPEWATHTPFTTNDLPPVVHPNEYATVLRDIPLAERPVRRDDPNPTPLIDTWLAHDLPAASALLAGLPPTPEVDLPRLRANHSQLLLEQAETVRNSPLDPLRTLGFVTISDDPNELPPPSHMPIPDGPRPEHTGVTPVLTIPAPRLGLAMAAPSYGSPQRRHLADALADQWNHVIDTVIVNPYLAWYNRNRPPAPEPLPLPPPPPIPPRSTDPK